VKAVDENTSPLDGIYAECSDGKHNLKVGSRTDGTSTAKPAIATHSFYRIMAWLGDRKIGRKVEMSIPYAVGGSGDALPHRSTGQCFMNALLDASDRLVWLYLNNARVKVQNLKVWN
jgi:hypothetical protein